jgi:FMN phosphatase YigB (HAD superfamily)
MENGTTRAVLFDFGGTLYDYAVLAEAERESLLALVRWAGSDADATACSTTT